MAGGTIWETEAWGNMQGNPRFWLRPGSEMYRFLQCKMVFYMMDPPSPTPFPHHLRASGRLSLSLSLSLLCPCAG